MATVPVPRTWANGEFVTDAIMNGSTGVKGPLTFLLAPPLCRVRRTTALAQATATWTAVAWDAEDDDTDGMHTAGSSGIIATTAGLYRLEGMGAWASNATGVRAVRWTLNGTPINAGQSNQTAVSGFETMVSARTIRQYLNVGDTLVMELYQTSGASLGTPTTAATQPHADVEWCAP